MQRVHRFALQTAFIALILGMSLQHISAFPLNGDFERDYRGTPFGWEKSGGWAFLPIGSFEGKGHYILRERMAKPGSELLSRSFLLVEEGDVLSIGCAYQAAGEGMSIALVFCDALGRPLGERWEAPLAPADAWRTESRLYIMGSLPEPEGTVAVRVALRMDAEGIEARADAVSLSLVSPTDARRPWEIVRFEPWSGRSVIGPLGTELSADCVPGEPDIWLSEPVRVDGTFPYAAEADLTVEADAATQSFLLLRALGGSESEVLWQEMQPVPPGRITEPVSAHLPAPYIEPLVIGLQAGLAVESAMPATVVLSALHVRPVPLEVSINGVQRKTAFDTPGEVQVFVSAVNNTSEEIATEALISAVDATGTIVHREQRTIRARARSAAAFPVRPVVPGDGSFTFRVSFLRAGVAVADGEFEFTVGAVTDEAAGEPDAPAPGGETDDR